MNKEELRKDLFGDTDKELLKSFKKFHFNNPEVLRLFTRFSLEAFDTGRKHYSHWSVAQRIRWFTSIETTGKEFKLSNDYIAVYARVVVLNNPKLYGFFKFKKMKKVRSRAVE